MRYLITQLLPQVEREKNPGFSLAKGRSFLVKQLEIVVFFLSLLAFSDVIVRVSWTGQGRGFSLSDSASRMRRAHEGGETHIHPGNGFNEATLCHAR